jgi:hypothetical protein
LVRAGVFVAAFWALAAGPAAAKIRPLAPRGFPTGNGAGPALAGGRVV